MKNLTMNFRIFMFTAITAMALPALASADYNLSQTGFNESQTDDHGVVYGQIFNDLNGDGVRNPNERGLKNFVVYLDENDNGARDPGERVTRSQRHGFYVFTKVPTGNHVVRQELRFGWRNTSGGNEAPLKSQVVGPKDNIEVQIIGGDVTKESEYPFMVAVGVAIGERFDQNCGGVLITDRWVATAAHCSEGIAPSQARIVAGTNNIDDNSGQILDVVSILLHPEYLLEPSEPGGVSGVRGGYDIALWELARPIALRKSNLQSVAMLTRNNRNLAEDGILATAVGWGVSDLTSRLLQDVHLPIFDSDLCQQANPSSINFDTQICAGILEGGIAICRGDSGGPLLVRDFAGERWKLAGITSYGNGCGDPNEIDVWSRVSELSSWARKNARETSRAHRVNVAPFSSTIADFANQSTRFEPSSPIEPRWQLANAEITNIPNEGLFFNWHIIDESPSPRALDCLADADGLAPGPGITVECFAGENQTVLPPLRDGVYVASLTASEEGTSFSRSQSAIIGTPTETNVSGTVTIDDSLDPDFEPPFRSYIDYYELTGITGDRAIALRAVAENNSSFFTLTLYDRDVRESLGSRGELQGDAGLGSGASPEIIFIPQPGINYVIGVSALEPTVNYNLSVLNEGSAIPTTLTLPKKATLGDH